MKDYYKNGQRVLIGGVPCKVAKWVTKDMLRTLRCPSGDYDFDFGEAEWPYLEGSLPAMTLT